MKPSGAVESKPCRIGSAEDPDRPAAVVSCQDLDRSPSGF